MTTTSASTSSWLDFFTAAGIPAGVATNYAIIFTDNRIQTDMLLDLNKEYLKDMGIHVMGDIIAILKYAKLAHEQKGRERVLGLTKTTPANTAPKARVITAKQENSTKPKPAAAQTASRLSSRVNNDAVIPAAKTQSPSGSIGSPVGKKIVRTIGKDTPGGVNKIIIKKKVAPVKQNNTVSKSTPSASRPTTKIQVTTTPVSKKVEANATQQRKCSVFERLGESNVSSTSDVGSTRITITGLGNNIVKGPKQSAGSKFSVFNRLGVKAQVSSTSNICEDNNEASDEYDDEKLVIDEVEELELSPAPSPKRQKITLTNTVPTQKSVRFAENSVYSRLGTGIAKSSSGKQGVGVTSAGILAAPQNSLKPGIKERLGGGKKIALKSTVQSRIGKVVKTRSVRSSY